MVLLKSERWVPSASLNILPKLNLFRHNLAQSIHFKVSQFNLSPVSITAHISNDLPQVSDAVKNGLIDMLQEALSNVVRHSGATRCEIKLYTNADSIVLSIKDDGCGIPPQVYDGGEHYTGVGLYSMRQLTCDLGGWLTMCEAGNCSSECPGTLITITIPVAPVQ